MAIQQKRIRNVAHGAKLWRYMNLSQFLWMLSERAIYFSTLAELEDKWEGALPAGFLEILLTEMVSSERFEDLKKRTGDDAVFRSRLTSSLRSMISGLQEGHRFSCWHENNVESVAMWKLYTRGIDGVAIQTTSTRLHECLSSLPNSGFWYVYYSDHEPDYADRSFTRVVEAMFVKRRSFEHEREVRAILLPQKLDPGKAERMALGQSDGVWPSGGVVRVNIARLIERIVVSPDYPAFAIPSLQAFVKGAGLEVTVETSDLLRLPDLPMMPQVPEK
jgi:hypothetical protein